MKKQDAYLAVFIGTRDTDSTKERMWDMLRYDRCHPVSIPTGNYPGFIVVKQPSVKDVEAGFTLDRWKSFGFINLAVVTVPAGSPNVPYDLFVLMNRMLVNILADRERRGVKCEDCGWVRSHDSRCPYHDFYVLHDIMDANGQPRGREAGVAGD